VTGRRTWRWLDRLRAAIGRGPSSDSTSLEVFSARSQPLGVANPPPSATHRAPHAHDRPSSAPASLAPPDTAVPAEAPEVTVARDGHGASEVGEAAASPEAREALDAPTSAASGPSAPVDPSAPPVRVHERRLERGVAPMELSPTEALRLATEGPTGLSRRDLPPDAERT
jgi:hypothetical protein